MADCHLRPECSRSFARAAHEELKQGTSGHATVSLRALIDHIRDEYDLYNADVRKQLNEQLNLPWEGGKITTVIAHINSVAAIYAGHNNNLTEMQKCDDALLQNSLAIDLYCLN